MHFPEAAPPPLAGARPGLGEGSSGRSPVASGQEVLHRLAQYRAVAGVATSGGWLSRVGNSPWSVVESRSIVASCSVVVPGLSLHGTPCDV